MEEMMIAGSQLPSVVGAGDLQGNSENNKMVAQKYLTFKIAGEVYGTDIDSIQEIIEYGAMTHVPLTPPHIRGVSNLRGNVIPIVDLAVRLDKHVHEVSKRTCIIIVELQDGDETLDIGFVVDEVDEVLDIEPDQIEAAPQFGTDIRSDFVKGMGKLDGQFVILLFLDEVLSVKELSELILSEQDNS